MMESNSSDESEVKVKQVVICLRSASKSVQSDGVVLDNVVDNTQRDMLSMLVENMLSLDDGGYSLEIIWETNNAVITFSSPAGRTGFSKYTDPVETLLVQTTT